VLQNQIMLGSVNASRDHYQMAVRDLQQASMIWEGLISELITNRYAPGEHEAAFGGHAPDEIKAVIEWVP
jgi:hypothetical protein